MQKLLFSFLPTHLILISGVDPQEDYRTVASIYLLPIQHDLLDHVRIFRLFEFLGGRPQNWKFVSRGLF